MNYTKFQYIYPPRPEYKTQPGSLNSYDNGEYIAQPKYNGSACIVFTNGEELHLWNRHKMQLANASREIQFKSLAKTKNWYVYAGEYLNKGKIGETGMKEQDKFVIWDVLVWDGEYLVGKTLMERLVLLEQIYPCKRAVVNAEGQLEAYKHLCCTEFKGIYKAPAYTGGFVNLYQSIIRVDLYEGLVLKKIESKLGYGLNEINNADWQIKCRKENKLYNF